MSHYPPDPHLLGACSWRITLGTVDAESISPLPPLRPLWFKKQLCHFCAD